MLLGHKSGDVTRRVCTVFSHAKNCNSRIADLFREWTPPLLQFVRARELNRVFRWGEAPFSCREESNRIITEWQKWVEREASEKKRDRNWEKGEKGRKRICRNYRSSTVRSWESRGNPRSSALCCIPISAVNYAPPLRRPRRLLACPAKTAKIKRRTKCNAPRLMARACMRSSPFFSRNEYRLI